MRKVIQVFCFPEGAYKGGIINIINNYKTKEALFEQNGYTIEYFNHQLKHNIFYRILPGYIRSKVINIFYLFSQRIALLTHVSGDKQAIIHIQSSRKWTLFRDLLLIKYIKKKCDNPIVITIHFADIKKILYINNILYKYELKIINKYVDRIIFLSNKVKNEFIHAGVNEKIAKVLYTFHTYNINNHYDKKYRPFNLLFMGSIDQRKGIIDLLHVINIVEKLNIILHICGGMPNESIEDEFNKLCRKSKNRIINHGYVQGEKKEMLLNEANVVVLPSYAEGMPIVLMEAMAYGCGIIATNVGGIPEIIQSKNGILIEPGNIRELLKAIKILYNDRHKLKAMERFNINDSKKYNIDKNIYQLVNIYNEI